jgi:ribosomal protein L29
VQGCAAHFSNTQVFEKWSKAKIALFALRAEKAMQGLFQHLNNSSRRRVSAHTPPPS